MKSINNHKTLTAIVAISAIAVVLTGSVHIASAQFRGFGPVPGTSIAKTINNPGINMQTDTDQKQECLTAGANSGLANSCTETSTNTNTESGGMLHK